MDSPALPIACVVILIILLAIASCDMAFARHEASVRIETQP